MPTLNPFTFEKGGAPEWIYSPKSYCWSSFCLLASMEQIQRNSSNIWYSLTSHSSYIVDVVTTGGVVSI